MTKKTWMDLSEQFNKLFDSGTAPVGPHIGEYELYKYGGFLKLMFPDLETDTGESSDTELENHLDTCMGCIGSLQDILQLVETWENPKRQLHLSFIRQRLTKRDGPFAETIEGRLMAIHALMDDEEFVDVWEFVDPTLFGFHSEDSEFITYALRRFDNEEDRDELERLEKHFANCKHCREKLVGLLESDTERRTPEGKERLKKLRWNFLTDGIDPETPEGKERLANLGLTTYEDFE